MTREPKLFRNRTKKSDIPKRVDGKKVAKAIEWKVYYDTITKLPLAPLNQGYCVVIADRDKELPPLVNPVPHVEERNVVMLILEK